MLPPRFAAVRIVADDLSGACDSVAAFAGHGSGEVRMRAESAGARAAYRTREGRIQALDAHSRARPAAEAAQVFAQAFAEGFGPRAQENAAATDCLHFHKLDSTLRGHIGAELIAARNAVGAASPIWVCPAFPAQGRTLREGQAYLDGKPLSGTALWSTLGLASDHLPTLLRAAGLRVNVLALPALRALVNAGAAPLGLDSACDALVCDAQTDDDLALLATLIASRPGPVLAAGSAGLARQLAAHVATAPAESNRDTTHAAGATALATTGRLAVIGSMSALAAEQVQALAATCLPVPCSPRMLIDGAASAAWLAQRQRVADALALGHDVVIHVEGPADPALDGSALCAALARFAAPMAQAAAGLVLSGGESARAVLETLGVSQLTNVRALVPGVTSACAQLRNAAAPAGFGHDNKTVPVCIKAGAFGQRDTLLACMAHLRQTTAPASAADAMRASPTHPEQASPANTRLSERPMYRPRIAITMGDAAGVGPEIIVKCLADGTLYAQCRPFVVGDAARLEDALRRTGTALRIARVTDPDEATFEPGTLACIDLALIPADTPYGKVSAICGDAAYRYIARAVEFVQAGKVDAICTAPLNKEALHLGGHRYPGHTEMLAALTGTEEVSMMLLAPNLRVIHVTTHIGILDAVEKINAGLVERTIARGLQALQKSGIAQPRVAVCGINPHAGENGLFGRGEEAEKIAPAVAACRARGWLVDGPLPADTLFYRATRGDFDLVVAMYHDQGHGPVKVLGLEAGVNVTIGLPAVRTSVDHGTAFDIAGKGVADPRSMTEAMLQAIAMAPKPDAGTVQAA
ncbi:4-hydroxythreonine-4-phosphate dehydrogenase PdxA [Cupriavidus sp. CV2]|uniref:4-hydroxythreonine-4-phosphate dehydrogenase PdxA n=1 Tax=Cupriavidus ulmosensis TaxID=3065913 RepID=UPI00296B18F7|nr:4-hydroxythreonine-4-phosphate dehydrogenase PdxA [Cupriavidus sp. CV2]MDW3686908.1 4-hydroxythreonine-4-phosphate dehydrogenase PdxA [Cupriavidus sp. CV2]